MLKRILAFALTLPFFVSLAVQSFAQGTALPPGAVTSPVLSFLLDHSGSLHSLNGIAGSASVGPSLNLGVNINQAVVSPAHDYILADTANGLLLVKGQGSILTAEPINVIPAVTNNVSTCYSIAPLSTIGRKLSTCIQSSVGTVTPQIDVMSISTTGSVAAVYSQAQQKIYSLNNLSQVPTLIATLDTQALGTISALAVSDDGQSIVTGTTTGALFLLKSPQGPQMIGTVGHVSAVRMFSNSSDAVVADDGTNTIYRITDGQLFTLATTDDGIASPNSLAISNDNQKVFVGNSQTASITTLHLSGEATESTACNCSVAGLFPTNTDSVFRLTDYSGAPVLLFDYSGITPRIVFAPSAPQF